MHKSPRRYPWPASCIDREVMHELHCASRDTGLPISRLIGDAVHADIAEQRRVAKEVKLRLSRIQDIEILATNLLTEAA